jgi:hypothetical protein
LAPSSADGVREDVGGSAESTPDAGNVGGAVHKVGQVLLGLKMVVELFQVAGMRTGCDGDLGNGGAAAGVGDVVGCTKRLGVMIGKIVGVDGQLLEGLLGVMEGEMTTVTARKLSSAICSKNDDAKIAVEVIVAMIGLAGGQVSMIAALAIRLGVFEAKEVKRITVVIAKLAPLISTIRRSADEQIGQRSTLGSHVGAVDAATLFNNFDVDKTGLLEFDQFLQCTKLRAYPNPVDRGLVMRIFVDTDITMTNSLTLNEFTQALAEYDNAISEKVLFQLEYSPGHIAQVVVGMTALLLIIFGFIFTGIVAFATAGAFSATINSLFPLLAGAGLSKKSTSDESEDTVDLDQKVLAAQSEGVILE